MEHDDERNVVGSTDVTGQQDVSETSSFIHFIFDSRTGRISIEMDVYDFRQGTWSKVNWLQTRVRPRRRIWRSPAPARI